jgi:hypothetical protein
MAELTIAYKFMSHSPPVRELTECSDQEQLPGRLERGKRRITPTPRISMCGDRFILKCRGCVLNLE